jgi:hypothetical protein
MPNWKKVIVSGSDAVLNSVSGSSFVYSGADVTAAQNLRSINSSGDEGGEIFLNKAVTNTTLTGGVTIDVYQNRLRFFEQGGTARGYFLDITAGGAGAATNLASGGGTVTSVSTAGTVSGITLTGGPITGAGTITLGGSISGLTNSNLSGTAGITNANLANSSVTIGSTAISLGGTSTTLAGLTNVTSTNFTGSLLGTASFATTAGIAGQATQAQFVKINDDSSTAAARPVVFTDVVGSSQALSTDASAFTYNPSTDTLSVSNLIGTASVANTVGTVRQGANATYFPTFVDSNNASAAPEQLYTSTGGILTYNPSQGLLTATTFSGSFSGSLSGNATTATTAATASSVGTLNQNVSITGSLRVNGSQELTGSLKITNGATKVMDTTVGNLYDVYGGTSVNFGSNQLLNYYGANVVNWGSNFLLSNNNTNASTMSIDWESRYLADTAGTQRLKWTTSGVQVTGSLIVTAGITGSLQGTASLATTATSASTQLITTNALHYPVFVDANNLAPTSEKLGTVAGYSFNPGTVRLEITGSLFATNITGSLQGTASYATMASQSGYTMQFVLATTGSNPAASTIYRLGAPVRTQLNTITGRTRIYVPRPGKVRHAHIYIRTNGTLASAGTSTLSLNKNSSIGETLATSTTAGSSADAVISSTAVSMSVVQGDFLEMVWTTPAWATLPTAVEANGIIYIENNI